MNLRQGIIPFVLGICLLTFLANGCAVNPVSGQRETVLISAEKERELGAQEAKNVEQTMGLVNDAEILEYVQAVGQRLARKSPRRDVRYHFYIVDLDLPNAFALPGGYVYVSRGLLALVNSEDELAGVMGHEIGHVAGRHAVQRITRTAATSPFRIFTGLAGAAVSMVALGVGNTIAEAGQVASALVIAPYSRDQEREADRVGQEMAAKAGWNPAGLSSLLKSLGRAEKLQSGEERQSSFFDTHPATGERVANTSQRANQLRRVSAPPIAKDPAALLAKLDGLRVGDDPAKGLFVGDDFYQPMLDFFISLPGKWKQFNTNEAIVAQAPDEKSLLLVQVAAKGKDPVAWVRQLEKEQGFKILDDASRIHINGLPAVQSVGKANTSEGVMGVLFTWIAHKGLIYQITGLSPDPVFKSRRRVFTEAVFSFRPLSAEDWPKIKEARLRIVQAHKGETLEQLGKRVNSVWSVEETAVVNGLSNNARLSEGQLVKVAILNPFKLKRVGR